MRRNTLDISTVIVLATVLGAAAGFLSVYYYTNHQTLALQVQEAERARQEAARVPIITVTSTPARPAQPIIVGGDTVSSTTSTIATSTPPLAQGAFNLQVPFFPQAPKRVWDVNHEDYCEEASLLGVHAYIKHKDYSVDQMEEELQKMHDWEIKTFGYFQSTSVAETAQIAREYLGYKKVHVIENPTLEQIRAQVAAGHPVIVPADGKALKNPYFKNGGPTFHMFVVRGFTENGDVITNDPGTQHGENYVYKKEIFMAAIHDWDHGQDETLVATGSSRVLVID